MHFFFKASLTLNILFLFCGTSICQHASLYNKQYTLRGGKKILMKVLFLALYRMNYVGLVAYPLLTVAAGGER